MIFRVGNMGGLRKAVIHVKLVQEGGKLSFSVRNPVVKKVQDTEGTGLSKSKIGSPGRRCRRSHW